MDVSFLNNMFLKKIEATYSDCISHRTHIANLWGGYLKQCMSPVQMTQITHMTHKVAIYSDLLQNCYLIYPKKYKLTGDTTIELIIGGILFESFDLDLLHIYNVFDEFKNHNRQYIE